MNNLNQDELDFSHDELVRSVDREHGLISNRMSWLIGSNSFLLVPIAIVIGDGKLTDVESLFAIFCTLLGVAISWSLEIPIRGAHETIDVLRDRQSELLRIAKAKGFSHYHFGHPDYQIPAIPALRVREQEIHKRSGRIEKLLPRVLVVFWVAMAVCMFFAWNTIG